MTAWPRRTRVAALALLAAGCGLDRPLIQSNDVVTPTPRMPPQRQIAGQFLARANITATHSVEFWETEPGNVIMLQSFKPAGGDQSLDLGPMMLEAGGFFGGLYRKLLKDDNAALPAELLAADERRRHLPVRDASSPPAPNTYPADVAAIHGPDATAEATVAMPPGPTVKTSSALTTTSYSYGLPNIYCGDPEVDASWCPPGAYNTFATGSIQETIYWDAMGYNPQNVYSVDTLTVNHWVGGVGWVPIVVMGILPGYSERVTTSGTANYYQGSITGAMVSYAERYRLSFPYLSSAGVWPLWTQNEFGNDIQGITHDESRWILSRTEYSQDDYGVLGRQDFVNDLQQSGPDRYNLSEPPPWEALHYNHYGDIVYDPLTKLIFVSLNKDPGVAGGIGAVNPADAFRVVGQATTNPNHDCAWVALNPKTRMFYTSESPASVIHRNFLYFPNGIYRGAGMGNLTYSDITLVNPLGLNVTTGTSPSVGGINGGKVSSHGKLWVFASPWQPWGRNFEILGIDPYSGIIQVQQLVGVTPSDWTIWSANPEEAEGLDITESYTGAPGVYGQIHAQILGNNTYSDDQWSLVNFYVSDMARL